MRKFKVDGPSGARRRKNLHVNAVDVQEIEARRYIALNDFGSGRFQALSERGTIERQRLPRLDSLTGKRIALLDISKPRGDRFLDRLEQHLVDRGDVFLNRLAQRLTAIGATVRRYQKPTFTKPAPVDLRHEIATECEVVIEALAD